MLTVVGGTYIELCREPEYEELWGSGLRGACSLSGKGFDIRLLSCIGKLEQASAEHTCSAFDVSNVFYNIEETVSWEYYHPLTKPIAYSSVLDSKPIVLSNVTAEKILFYGMIEATIQVDGNYVVYDPQNGIPFHETNSKAQHLALVLNKQEALLLANMDSSGDLTLAGELLLAQEEAEVVIIKDGSNGGLIFTPSGNDSFPVYVTTKVWPIGSGDIFSAAFAWKWMMEGNNPTEAAVFASQSAAEFCETQVLPLPPIPQLRTPILRKDVKRKIYLAAPFFTSSERWLVNELRDLLFNFGNIVCSPYHDIGFINDVNSIEAQKQIAHKDLTALNEADVILAVLNGLDAGTIMELGYAAAKNKTVIALVENVNPNDLTMIIGSGCEIVNDISTAVYKASW